MNPESLAMSSRPRSRTSPRAVALVAAMAVGSVVMWLGIPAVWILIAAQVSRTGQPTLGPLLLVFFGTPLTMLPAAKLLGALDRRHQELTGSSDERRKPEPWRQSMRDARRDEGPGSVLAVVMVISVAIAFAALAVWFFFFAGSSLPS